MSNKVVMWTVIGIVVFFIFIFRTNLFDASGMDAAMQQYIIAVQDGDTGAFVDLLPDNHRFRFACSSGDTGNLMSAESYSKNQVISNFSRRGGLYYAIFLGDSNYRYSDRISNAPLRDWHRSLDTYRWQQGKLKSYVKWYKEGDAWKVIEVGDMIPGNSGSP